MSSMSDEPEGAAGGDEGLCPVCGSPLTVGAQFCGACGSHVPSPLVPYDAPTTPDGPFTSALASTAPGRSGLTIETGERCLACGAINTSGVERCTLCGASLADDPAESHWPSEPGRNGNTP